MPDTGITSSIDRLAGGYVFYKKLLDEGGRVGTLGKVAQRKFHELTKNESLDKVADTLLHMSTEEASKEAKLLHDVFGRDIDFHIDETKVNHDFYINLTNLINLNLSLQGIFKRNRDRLLKNTGIIDVAATFPNYFEKVWNNSIPQLKTQILKKYDSEPNKSLPDIVSEVFKAHLPKITRQAITEMLESQDFKTKQKDAARGYMEIAEAFKAHGRGSDEFLDAVKKIYGLDYFEQYLLEYTNGQTLAWLKKNMKPASFIFEDEATKDLPGEAFKRGGFSREALLTFTSETIFDMLDQKAQGKAFHMGDLNMRPDVTFTFKIDPSIPQDFFDKAPGAITRNQAQEALNGLVKRLENFSDGFITFVNAKTSTLKSIERNGGFKGGRGLTLGQLNETFNLAHIENTGVMISAIGSTMKEALMSSNKDRNEVRTLISSDIAYMLFDDVEVVGKQTGGAEALHLFDLNGIYIPLSLLLYELSQAIRKANNDETSLRKLVQVHFSYSDDAREKYYPHKDDPLGPGDGGIARWENQRSIAWEGIKISINFLSNIADIINELNPNLK